MKKIFTYFILGSISTCALSQSAPKDRLPKAGDYGFGIDGVPVADYILDKTRIFSNSSPTSASGLFSFYDEFIIDGKYMITDKKAFRGSLGLVYVSQTTKTSVPSVLVPEEVVENAVTRYNRSIFISAGKQFYRGDRNLRGFYGYDGILGIGQADRLKNTYGNELSEDNSSMRVTKENDGTELILGVNVFVGAEYYFVKNVSLSAEIGYSVLYLNKGGNSSTSEEFVDGAVNSETTKNLGSSNMSFGTDDSRAKLMLNFYF